MLQHTFVHAAGVGPSTERKIWSAGVHTWDAFLAMQQQDGQVLRKLQRLVPIIEDSHSALRQRDLGFFTSRLKSGEQWRVYREFCAQAAFVDIETTGLSHDFDQITVVGLLAGGQFHSFVQGENLDQFPKAIADYPLLVTFNGALFDLPFLRRQFPTFNPVAHVDLRYPLTKLGHRGGLKQIERNLGIVRPDHLREVDGYEAVRLWAEHRRGRAGALDKLVDYCRHDVMNLLPLAERVASEMPGQAGFPAR